MSLLLLAALSLLFFLRPLPLLLPFEEPFDPIFDEPVAPFLEEPPFPPFGKPLLLLTLLDVGLRLVGCKVSSVAGDIVGYSVELFNGAKVVVVAGLIVGTSINVGAVVVVGFRVGSPNAIGDRVGELVGAFVGRLIIGTPVGLAVASVSGAIVTTGSSTGATVATGTSTGAAVAGATVSAEDVTGASVSADTGEAVGREGDDIGAIVTA